MACKMIDAAQIRAARALLDVNQAQLSKLASVSATTIKRLEAASRSVARQKPCGNFRRRSRRLGWNSFLRTSRRDRASD